MDGFQFFAAAASDRAVATPVRVSTRTLRHALEQTLMDGYTRRDLEVVLAEELKLPWVHDDTSPEDRGSKRDLVIAYTPGWDVPRLIGLARRVVAELGVPADLLVPLLAEYDRGGGVGSPAKNLIFAANGPKPDLRLRDAVSNDIEIVSGAEFCLVYERPIAADGLRMRHLIDWWRSRENLPAEVDDRQVALQVHARLRASLGDNPVELAVFDAYAPRYRDAYDTPVLIPQVYLHYDPHTQLARRRTAGPGPLPRQRMDFLLLFSDRHRVVIEVDGAQHYADGQYARPAKYSAMMAEDRRLRLSGYEVYRFGGHELSLPGAAAMLTQFFSDLAAQMS